MTKKKNNPANATVDATRTKAKRAKKDAVAPEELDIDKTGQQELDINVCICICDEGLPCIGTPCQYKKNKKLEGKILPGKPAVRLSRQANDLAAKARDDSLDVYCHLVCCDVFAYGLWIQKNDARWYKKDEVLRMLREFPGMKELEDHIYDALHTASELSPPRIASASASASVDPDRNQARKLCERLRKYWWAQIEFAANKGELPTASDRLTLDSAKYVTKLDGVNNSLEELLKDSQEMSQGEVVGEDEDIDADDDMDDDEDSESDAH